MGPAPNNCVHRLRSSLLKPKPGRPFFTQGLVLAFDRADSPSRVDRARALLAAEGLPNVAAARTRFCVPAGRWLCRPYSDGQVYDDTPEEKMGIAGGMVFTDDDGIRPSALPPLHIALILGLCGPSCYSADRPFIWSEARLARRLALYRASHFYDETP